VIVRARSTGMEVNNDFTDVKRDHNFVAVNRILFDFLCKFCTVFNCEVVPPERGQIETRCLDTAHVGLPILLVMGLRGLSDFGFVNFWETIKGCWCGIVAVE